jgi:hypothetical protein
MVLAMGAPPTWGAPTPARPSRDNVHTPQLPLVGAPTPELIYSRGLARSDTATSRRSVTARSNVSRHALADA